MAHSSINNRLTNKTSISTPLTEYLYRLDSVNVLFYNNVESMPKCREENTQYLLSSDKLLNDKCNTDELKDEILGIDTKEMLQKLFDMHQKYISKEGDRQQLKSDIQQFIDSTIKTIEKLKVKHKNIFQQDILDLINIGHSKIAFEKGMDNIDKLLSDLRNANKEAKEMAKNEASKTLIMLLSKVFWHTHSGMMTYIVTSLPKANVIMINLFRTLPFSNPYIAFAVILALCFWAIWRFFDFKESNELKIEIYRLYIVLNNIVQYINKQDSFLVNIINFNKKISGNVFFEKADIKYITSPSQMHNIQTIMPKNNTNIIDKIVLCKISHKESFKDLEFSSLLTTKETAYSKASYHKNQYFALSIFPIIKEQLQDSDITNASAFKHLKNLTLQFNNFLFIKTPYLSSTIMLDMILQSITQSSQQNKPLIEKYMLFITLAPQIDSPQYKTYNFIKEVCNNNNILQNKVLFLNTINQIEKQVIFENFRQVVYENYTQLERCYNNKHKFKEFLYNDKKTVVREFLDNFCQNCENKDLMQITEEFSEIYSLIFAQEHLFEDAFLNDKENKQAKQYANHIINALFAFDSIMSNFIDFKKQSKQQGSIAFDDKDLKELRNKVRQSLNEADICTSVFCIANIFNNAYFSNAPTQEISSFKNLMDKYTKGNLFQKYKDNILKKQGLTLYHIHQAIELLMPFVPSIFVAFFPSEQFNELCIFILYLIDMEIGGLFIYTAFNLNILQDLRVKMHLNSQTIQELLRQDFKERFDETMQDSIVDSVLDFVKEQLPKDKIAKNASDITHFLLSLLAKESKKKLKNIIENTKLMSNKLAKTLENTLNDADKIRHLNNVIDNTTLQNLNIEFYKIFFKEHFPKQQKELSISILQKSKLLHKNTAQALLPFILKEILNKQFPSISKIDLKRQVTFFLLSASCKQDRIYSKWEKKDKYFYVPKELSNTILIGDFHASLILDTALDSSYCIHNPSIGLYANSIDLAKQLSLNELRSNINSNIDIKQTFSLRTDKIFKEAYCKVLHYLDMGTDDSMQYLQERLKMSEIDIKGHFNFANLNSTNKAINTKIKKDLNEGSDDDNFRHSTSKYIKDFLIQLKRIAEWNHEIYMAKNTNISKEKAKSEGKKSAIMLGNFIYNENFIQTTIDVND
ncbi:hypothetical protein [Campylobacter troglodytis]|uniref:hypothetical protein n=1 Tax=Campylobacter troglodytis TaxID=654363 RepID=UPI00115C0D02|nr:hypothetical protein [Campylobacter troglodytis]TQR53051.1 hypothetical protein DMC01_12230 [Campylobacter troglodytis]